MTALLITRLNRCVQCCLGGHWQSRQRGMDRASSAETFRSPVNSPRSSCEYTSAIPTCPSSVSAVKKWPHPRITIGASRRSISQYVFISRRSTRASWWTEQIWQKSSGRVSPHSPEHWCPQDSFLEQRWLHGRRLHGAARGMLHFPLCSQDQVHSSTHGAHASWHRRVHRECAERTCSLSVIYRNCGAEKCRRCRTFLDKNISITTQVTDPGEARNFAIKWFQDWDKTEVLATVRRYLNVLEWKK